MLRPSNRTFDIDQCISQYYADVRGLRMRLRCSRARDKWRRVYTSLRSQTRTADLVQYHCPQSKNLGDCAIGLVVREYFRGLGFRVVARPIVDACWEGGKFGCLVGGGGFLHARLLDRIASVEPEQSPTAIIGVDVFGTPQREFPGNVVYAAARSRHGAQKLSLLGCERPLIAPDVVWAAPLAGSVFAGGIAEAARPASGSGDARWLGMNVTAWPRKYHFARMSRKSDETSESDHQTLADYGRCMRALAEAHLAQGWRVECVAFEIDDEYFARKLFSGTGVSVRRFSSDTVGTFNRLKRYTKFIATRYHSHIFALLTGVPVLSVAYGPNCEQIWQEYGWDRGSQVTAQGLLEGWESVVEEWTKARGFVLEDEERNQLVASAGESLRTAAERLGMLEAA